MHTDQFYDQIAAQLLLNHEECEELRQAFPDPAGLTTLDTPWTGNDVCDYFERERRSNRAHIDVLIRQYLKADVLDEIDAE